MRLADAKRLVIGGQEAVRAVLNGQEVWTAGSMGPRVVHFHQQATSGSFTIPDATAGHLGIIIAARSTFLSIGPSAPSGWDTLGQVSAPSGSGGLRVFSRVLDGSERSVSLGSFTTGTRGLAYYQLAPGEEHVGWDVALAGSTGTGAVTLPSLGVEHPAVAVAGAFPVSAGQSAAPPMPPGWALDEYHGTYGLWAHRRWLQAGVSDVTFAFSDGRGRSAVHVMAQSNPTAPELGWADVIEALGPVHWWRFEEAPGSSTVADSAGSNHGIVHGAQLGVPSPLPALGSAAAFDGVDDWIDVGNVDPSIADKQTWIFVADPAGATTDMVLVIAMEFILGISLLGAIAALTLSGETTSADGVITGGELCVFTIDYATGTVRLWVDGTEVDITNLTPGPTPSLADLAISGANVGLPYSGVLDELAVFRRILTDAEIAALTEAAGI